MGLLDQIIGGVLSGQRTSGSTPSGGLGGLGDLLSGLGGGGSRSQGGASQMIAALLPVLLGMLANRSSGNAGGGGLEGLLRQFQAAGLGQQADSWVGTGPNMAVSADDLARVFGRDQLAQLASRAGMGEEEAAGGLASLLPEFVNQLTPQGQVPAQSEVEDALSSLQRSLGI